MTKNLHAYFAAAGVVPLGILGYGLYKHNSTATIVGGALAIVNLMMWTKAGQVSQEGAAWLGYFAAGAGGGSTSPTSQPTKPENGNGNTGPGA